MAATLVLIKTHGLTVLRNTFDRKRHPARAARIAAGTAGLVGTAALVAGVSAATPNPSTAPIGWTEQIGDSYESDDAGEDGAVSAVFVYYDRIPGQPAPEPIDFTYASPWP